jgi:hypothetical protein
LEPPIYKSLLADNIRKEPFDDLYARRIKEVASPDLDHALSNTLEIMTQHVPDAPMYIVESGAQGTIPLMLLSLAKGGHKLGWQESDFSMYACLPWL